MLEIGRLSVLFSGQNGKEFARPICLFYFVFKHFRAMKLSSRPGSLRRSRGRETVRLFIGLALVSTLWGCGPSYSERIWDRGLRPVIQVIPERDWAAEVPMCPSCLATTTRLPMQNYLIKV